MKELPLRSWLGVRPSLLVAAFVTLVSVGSIAGVLAAAHRRLGPRPAAAPPSDGGAALSRARAAHLPAPVAAAVAATSPPARRSLQPPSALGAVPDAGARSAAAALLAEASEARRQGDLRTTLALLQAAVERAPAVETHAALGTLYLELGAARRAESNLRAAAEGDPGNADRWLALANALALKPDPFAAAEARQRAEAVEPGLRITRDTAGRLAREPAPSP